MKPRFFIVGAQKCGTTSLYHYLRQHPGLFLPDRVEMSYFSDAHGSNAIADLDDYLSYFADAGDLLAGEKSAIYLFSDETPRRLVEFSPGAKIVIMVRHPVELMASLHRQFLFTGNEDILDFEEALRAADDRARGERIPKGAHLVGFLQYRRVARLARQVRRYQRVFGNAHVHVALLEDLIDNPRRTYRAILEFLGADPDFVPDFKVHNAAKPVPPLMLRKMTRGNPRFNRAFHRIVPKKLVEGARTMLSSFQPQPEYPVDGPLFERLLSEFDPEIRELADVIDRDLSHWLAPRRRRHPGANVEARAMG